MRTLLSIAVLLILSVGALVTVGSTRSVNPDSCRMNSDCPNNQYCKSGLCWQFDCNSDRDCLDGFFCDLAGGNICRNRLRQTIQELTNRLDQENLQRATLEAKYNALIDAMNRVPKLDRPLPDNWKEGVNLPGSDIRNMSLVDGSPAQCERECISDRRCKAWSFVLPGVQGPLAQCWLKDNASIQGVPDPKVTSGIIQR